MGVLITDEEQTPKTFSRLLDERFLLEWDDIAGAVLTLLLVALIYVLLTIIT